AEPLLPCRVELEAAAVPAGCVVPVAAVLALHGDVPARGAVEDRVGAVRPRVGGSLAADDLGGGDLLASPVGGAGRRRLVELQPAGVRELNLKATQTDAQRAHLAAERS